MSIPDFLEQHNVEHTFLWGFYGGGNYGDELLMEVLAGLCKQRGLQDVSIAYQHPETYATFHHEFGYARVPMHNKKAMLQAIFRKRNIIIGGGGLWGMDANRNVLLMSLLLFISRWCMGKKVYLLGVGFYTSSPRIGRMSAWLAAKAATMIIARDDETYENFIRWQPRTEHSSDIAWHIRSLDLQPYEADVAALEKQLPLTDKTIFITLRRFRDYSQERLVQAITGCIAQNPDKPLIIALLEPRYVDPEGYALLRSLQRAYTNVRIIDFAFNPLALYVFFQKHHSQLLFVGPQFHAILSAHLTGVPYLPLVYDNKVHNLLQVIAPEAVPLPVTALTANDIQTFITRHYPIAA